MHGISRKKQTSSAEEQAKVTEKIKKYVAITEELKKRRLSGDYSLESLEIASQVLMVNSEYYTAWSFRRRVLMHLDAQATETVTEGETTTEAAASTRSPLSPIYEKELRFCEELLRRHPKSYWMWLHRQWLLERLRTQPQYEGALSPDFWQKELGLCSQFLDADTRNFHGWNYRRWVASRSGATLESELAYTSHKIAQDFSNYSAWQHRALLYQEIRKALPAAGDDEQLMQSLEAEFELVRQAFFTEPDDQSAWFYHRWLLNQVPETHLQRVLNEELEHLEELISEEPRSKWALLSSVHIIKKMTSISPELEHRVTQRHELLLEVDPDRANYYRAVATK